MVKESKYCSKATQAQFNKLLVLSEKDHEDFLKQHMKKVK